MSLSRQLPTATRKAEINLALHAKQGLALASEATEILYGGAAGGGKSHLMRTAATIWCAGIPGLQSYLFRRHRGDLIKTHIEGPQGFRAMLAPWVNAGLVTIIEDEVRFNWNGSKIYLCHCKDERDRFNYLSAEIHVLLIDQLEQFTEVMYRFLRGRVRMAGINVPPEFAGLFPRILAGANPGDIGHLFCKSTFVDDCEDLEIRRMPDEEGGMLRQYIKSKLRDNPSLNYEEYAAKLKGLGSPALVKAMLEGDWNVIAGAFFPEFSTERHVLRPVELPEHWLRFRAADWGSAEPFSIGWYAVASEDWRHPDGTLVRRGALVKYREWYGMQSPNVGLKLHAEIVAAGISEREAGEDIVYGVIGLDAFTQNGGPSIVERMARAGCSKWRPADNTRVARKGSIGGWDQVRARLAGDGDGNAMLFLFSSCFGTIRTLPALQHDEARPEDAAQGEDHAPEETRYGCMSRPYMRPTPVPKEPIAGIERLTMDQAWKKARVGGMPGRV